MNLTNLDHQNMCTYINECIFSIRNYLLSRYIQYQPYECIVMLVILGGTCPDTCERARAKERALVTKAGRCSSKCSSHLIIYLSYVLQKIHTVFTSKCNLIKINCFVVVRVFLCERFRKCCPEICLKRVPENCLT